MNEYGSQASIKEKVKPGIGWYILAVVILFFGCSYAFYLYMSSFFNVFEQQEKSLEAPGVKEIVFEEKGRYRVYMQIKDTSGIYRASEEEPEMRFELKSAGTGQAVELREADGLDFSGPRMPVGEALMEFTIEKPGNYVFSSELVEEEEEQPDREISLKLVATMSPAKMFGGIWRSMLVGLGVLAVSFLIASVTFIKRDNAKRRMALRNDIFDEEF